MKATTYDRAIAEARTRTARLNAEIEADPNYARYAAEIDAEVAVATEMERVRKAAKLTQAEVAKRMGISQATISNALKGRVTVTTLRRFFDACGFDFSIKAVPRRKTVRQA